MLKIEIVHTFRFEGPLPGTFPVTVDQLTTQLNALGKMIMAKFDDLIAAVQASADSTNTALDSAVQRAVDTATKNSATIADLDKQVGDLKAEIANGEPTQAQTDAMAKLQSTIDAMRPKADGIDPSNSATLPV